MPFVEFVLTPKTPLTATAALEAAVRLIGTLAFVRRDSETSDSLGKYAITMAVPEMTLRTNDRREVV